MFSKKTSKSLLNQSGRSYLAETVQVEGEVTASGAIDVSGLVKGNVNVTEMIIFETGSVIGNLEVTKIVVDGNVEGKITADTVSLGSNAIIKGDILFKTSLKTAEGAEIDGYISKIKKTTRIENEDFDEISDKPELGKPTLVRGNKKEVV